MGGERISGAGRGRGRDRPSKGRKRFRDSLRRDREMKVLSRLAFPLASPSTRFFDVSRPKSRDRRRFSNCAETSSPPIDPVAAFAPSRGPRFSPVPRPRVPFSEKERERGEGAHDSYGRSGRNNKTRGNINAMSLARALFARMRASASCFRAYIFSISHSFGASSGRGGRAEKGEKSRACLTNARRVIFQRVYAERPAVTDRFTIAGLSSPRFAKMRGGGSQEFLNARKVTSLLILRAKKALAVAAMII